MKAKVYVTYKKDVLDPQGVTVKNTLNNLHYDNVKNVRIGKFINLEFSETDKTKVEEDLKKICNDVLSNPVIEDYKYEIEE